MNSRNTLNISEIELVNGLDMEEVKVGDNDHH